VKYLLVPQAFALLVGAALLVPRPVPLRTSERFRRAAVVVAAAGVVGSALALAVVEKRLWGQRTRAQGLSAVEHATQGGKSIGVNVGFVEWARRVIPPEDSFHLLISRGGRWNEAHGGRPLREAVYQWSTYRLHPRAARQEKAEWIVFYGVRPRDAGYRRSFFDRLRFFRDDYAVGRRAR
jgi:hypothetical protein